MNSLREMQDKMNAWMAEKPSGNFDNSRLRLNSGDIALFQFVANGDEGDAYIKAYRAHMFPGISQNGQRFSIQRFCPAKSGDNTECPYCQQGHVEIKERMSMWLWVTDLFRKNLPAKMPEGKVFPQVTFEGQIYFHEQVNDYKLWNTSAWKESPWGDIVKNAELYKGLHNFTAQLACSGTGMQTRYKFYVMPQSPFLSAEQYADAKEKCEPIPQMLMKEMATPVQTNPQAAQPNPQLQGFQLQANQVAPFVPPGQSVPAFQIPSNVAPPLPPPPVATPVIEVPERPIPEEAPAEPDGTQTIETVPQPEEEIRRPLKSMF